MMNQKKFNKPLIAIILTATLLCSTFIGVAFAYMPGQSVRTNLADYVVFEGVAANDYYDSRQYSYHVNQWANETVTYAPAGSTYGVAITFNSNGPQRDWFNAKKSIRIGMTEFGEFATPANAGIAYGASATEFANTESWASTGVSPQYWIQGWVFALDYTRSGGDRRTIEAWALFSDWVSAEAGRKVYSWNGGIDDNLNATTTLFTEGSLLTEGVKVLYDSARLAVGRTTVTIYDGKYQENVAKITFTVIYNKDTKYAIIYKDIKILLDTKVLDLINDISFSERYEIDLARLLNPSNQAYIHWYHNYNETVYMHPLTGQNLYDVVQAFDVSRQYMYFAAYWPNCTEYSVYSQLVPFLATTVPATRNNRILAPGTAIADIPGAPAGPGEPSTPWVIAQWRYNSTSWPKMLNFLAKDGNREIRFVEVAGMTDYNNGTSLSTQVTSGNYFNFNAKDDGPNPQNDPVNNVDIEVRYLLNSVFNPEDDLASINDAPFQWISVGQSSAATDSAASGALSDLNQEILQNPLPMFDRNDTLFTWTSYWAKGTIPYGLHIFGATGTTDVTLERARYFDEFSNSIKGTGTDTTPYVRTALIDFCFQIYDNQIASPPQPVAGGYSLAGKLTGSPTAAYWYPSKDPLTERWNGALNNMVGYAGILYHPNGLINVGGEKANSLSRYFNDYGFAITREGSYAYSLINNYNTNGLSGEAPTSNVSKATLDFFPLSTWASSNTLGYQNSETTGWVTITIARDINGTRGLQINGWDARDTYWGSAWASQYLGVYVNQGWFPAGTVALVLKISYSTVNNEPTAFTIEKALGTITEFGTNRFASLWGYDTVNSTRTPPTWNGLVTPPALPNCGEPYKVWWYAKLPTTSVAKVDFDP